MIREPTVFLLDEPFYALDPKGAITFRQLLKERCESGATILLSTHLLDLAEKLCDSFTVIDHGRTVANGNLQDFKERVDLSSSLEKAFLFFTGTRGPRK
jgi:ABC-2 type transport system ATP-binding protein